MAHLYALDCEVDSALASVQEKLENVDCSLAKVRTMVAAATMTENSGEKVLPD